jgi:predicted PurR-regulated permease PerM
MWSSQTKLVISLLVLAASIFLLHQFRTAIAPVVLAIILAYIFTPLVNRLQRLIRLPRILAILVVYLLMFVLIGGILWLVIPLLVSQVGRLELNFQDILNQLEKLFSGQVQIAGITFDGPEIFNRIADTLQQAFQPLVGQTFDVITRVVSSLVWVVFVLVISMYLIKDSDALSNWIEQLVPPPYRQDYNYLRTEISNIWSAFFRGQLLLALIVIVIITSLGFAVGLPYALAMGVLAGFLEFIPTVGHAVWVIIGATIALLRGSNWIPFPHWAFALLLVGLHVIFEQFDINYLIPRIIGRRVHLPPLVVILGIIAGAALAGVLGMVLAAPTIASLRVLGRYVYALLFDLEPFPESVGTQPLPPPDIMWWRKYRERFAPHHESEASETSND